MNFDRNEEYHSDDEIKAMVRQRRRKAELRRKRERERKIRVAIFCAVLLAVVIGIVSAVVAGVRHLTGGKKTRETAAETTMESSVETAAAEPETPIQIETEAAALAPADSAKTYSAVSNAQTAALNGDVISSYGILVDLGSDTIVAERNATTRISPASMTKILTLLVAAERVTDLEDTFTITKEITDFAYRNDCSSVGFLDGETVTIQDLFYGTILPSGGDAAAALATYVAGSQEAFVDMMNEKLAQLGLAGSAHVTNCVGLYDENHYCTPYDMAMIMEAAISVPFCREVLSARRYTTSQTEQHPDGIEVSNWFLRRIEDKDSGGTVIGAKTGYVVQSGNCAASYAEDAGGNGYVCVTANATSSWRCIYDHVAIYKKYLSRN